MKCFKKDGTLKKIYIDIIPYLEKAKKEHRQWTNYNNVVVDEYDCYKLTIDGIKKRQRIRHLEDLCNDLNIEYKYYGCVYIYFDMKINNIDEVLNIVR